VRGMVGERLLDRLSSTGAGVVMARTLDQRAPGRYRTAMSKAFTKEDDVTPDVVVPPRAKAPPPETAPIEQLRNEGKARLGARVKLSDGEGHEAEVPPGDAGRGGPSSWSGQRGVSLGAGVARQSAGDDVTVERPRGPAEYTVEAVWFAMQPAIRTPVDGAQCARKCWRSAETVSPRAPRGRRARRRGRPGGAPRECPAPALRSWRGAPACRRLR